MRVLLLNPVLRDGTPTLRVGRCQGKVLVGLWPNVEYGQLGAILARERHPVALLDANHERLGFRAMLDRAVAWAPDVVFLLSITAALEDDLEAGRRLAAALPRAAIAFWGTHATARPGDYLETDRFVAVRGEPDLTGRDLVAALAAGERSFEGVPGISWRSAGGPGHAPDRPPVADLDALPPADHRLMGTGAHRAAHNRRPFALVRTSRGCPHGCVFCTARTFHGARWRARAPEAVAEEVAGVARATGVRQFFLQSDVFGQGRAWTLELAERLLRAAPGIEWFANSRVDTVDAEVLGALARSGCRLLSFGAESGSDTVLRAIGKGATREQGLAALAAVRRAGILSLAYFVLGLPGETRATIGETFSFLREARPDYAHFYAPTPFPGSRLFAADRVAERIGRDVAWRDFFQGTSTAFVAPTVGRRTVRAALLAANLSFYGDPRRVAAELARLRSPRDLAGRAATLADLVRNYVVRG